VDERLLVYKHIESGALSSVIEEARGITVGLGNAA
jgi:hypothetical protein